MKLPRRKFLHLAAGAAALPALSRMSWAQTYPSRPVRLLIGFSAGGGADIVGRLIGQWLQELGKAIARRLAGRRAILVGCVLIRTRPAGSR